MWTAKLNSFFHKFVILLPYTEWKFESYTVKKKFFCNFISCDGLDI